MSYGVCEAPQHEGSRSVELRELVIRRTEWKDVATGGRYRTRDHRRECKSCVNRELRATPYPEPTLL